ncbi:hypothetical protein GCM10007424_10780 [Flavobacterium suaedae]|uniref:Uncharacterized protein n=1 Tax=Flavobacterium suaedae TaxID=1767027 RepID=A0ABQ1JMG7_9FLAO|nr:hypothetical protein [Flavobacterium suaedae]GGB72676.1 hypothetical protein GCM10007424_10780 [Flavobacterium suaedae]
MKKNFKNITAYIVALCSFIVFLSCETEEKVESLSGQETHSSLISIDEVLTKINSPKIKSTINNLTNSNLKSKLSDFEKPEYFEKIGVTDKFHQYTLYLNGYSAERPYFLYYIITVDTDLKEKSGFLRYTPNQAIAVLDATKFSGKLELLSDDMELQADIPFEQGQPLSLGTTVCVESVIINVYNCSNGGEHSPGESCAPGYVNDAYYSFVDIVENCWTEFNYNTSPGTFVGGGGPGLSNIDIFNSKLTTQQQSFLDNNPSIKDKIYDGIERSVYVSMALSMVDLGMRDMNLFNLLLNHIEEHNYSQSSTRFVSWALDYLDNNNSVSAEVFENQFMGLSEGQDGVYDAEYWEDPNLTFPPQELPSWEDF